MISQHWHGESWSAAPGVSFPPHRGHSFDLGVEVETLGRKSQCCLDCFQSGTTKTEPASRRSLCHRGSCLWTRWRTSLAGEPGWGHSLQPNNGNFVNWVEQDQLIHVCQTCPTSMSAVNFLAVAPLVVKIAVPFPVAIIFSLECTKNALLFNFWNHRGCCWWAQWLPRGCQHSKHKALVQKSPLCRPGSIGLEWVTTDKVCH